MATLIEFGCLRPRAISAGEAFFVVRAGKQRPRGEGNENSCGRNIRARQTKERVNLTGVPKWQASLAVAQNCRRPMPRCLRGTSES